MIEETAPARESASCSAEVDLAVDAACARVAPAWPLDRFIAVNPFWELTSRPLRDVAAELGALCGATLLMPLAWYRDAWREGRLTEEHLRAVARRHGGRSDAAALRALLEGDEPEAPRRSLYADVVDGQRDLARGARWSEFITHATSQACAAYFDEGQAALRPDRAGGLYASWRRQARRDRAPRILQGFAGFERPAGELPPTASGVFESALRELEVPPRERERYLASLLLAQNGWASWCAYRRWTARLEGGDDATLRDLLAIRLAWEWMLRRDATPALVLGWRHAMAAWGDVDAVVRSAQDRRWLLQEAVELAWQAPLALGLRAAGGAPRPTGVAAQVVFCIDVRSEVLRRAVEARAPVQTLGFAGFFGLPAEYAPLGSTLPRPHLPGLLAPRLRVADEGGSEAMASDQARRLGAARGWDALKRGAASAFTFVEACGVAYAAALAADSFGLGDDRRDGLDQAARRALRPRLTGSADGRPLSDDARAALAAGILRGMSLTRGFAPIVVLLGHCASTRNNPHAAGLHCGACGGQSGEVSARATAALLNDAPVRAGLAERGIEVPAGTRFVAGLHDTTTDEVTFFDLDELPVDARPAVEGLRAAFRLAGDDARAERALALDMGELPAGRLRDAFRARAKDWAEVRPEWGLAGNAAFIAAPRESCRHLDLRGRAFLHEYRHAEDPDLTVLESILTAPVVVAHWINFQYYASTVDNPRYGSGNKVLHNVVGGHLGVFEGNGGDLRVGLPLQSVHDGARWAHEPLRLSVFVEATTDALDSVLLRHDRVRQLVEHGWLHLFQIDGDRGEVRRRTPGGWRSLLEELDRVGPADPPAR